MRIMKPRYIAAFFAILLSMTTTANANLVIAPTRFVFEDKTRNHTLMMLNADSKPHTYRLGWKLMRMSEKGDYEDLPMTDAAASVPKMVIFSPRQVTLAGNGRQNVRLSLRRPADLPPGEYRGHLLFDEVAEDGSPRVTQQSDGQGVQINVALSFTVPVIVRSGNVAFGEVSIGDPQVQTLPGNPQQTLKLDINHTPGLRSVYGRVSVMAGDEEIGILNNIAIYPEMAKRTVNVPLKRAVTPGSNVTVSYIGDNEYKGKTLATRQATVTQ